MNTDCPESGAIRAVRNLVAIRRTLPRLPRRPTCSRLRSNIANVAPRNLLPARPPTPMLFRVESIRVHFERQNRIHPAALSQRPPCEIRLSHFGADRYFPLLARLRRLACANGPKSRAKRTALEALGGISVAKARTGGPNSQPQRPMGRRRFLPGCVATAMDPPALPNSLVAGNFSCSCSPRPAYRQRKRRRIADFSHSGPCLRVKKAGNSLRRCREFGVA